MGVNIIGAIPVLFQFYIALPIVVYLLGDFFRARPRLTILMGIMALIAYGAAYSWMTTPLVRPLANQVSLAFYGSAFLIGALSAYALHTWHPICSNLSQRFWFFLTIIGIGGLAAALPSSYQFVVNAKFGPALNWSFLAIGLLWVLVISGLLFGDSLANKILSSPALQYLGQISYSAYLVHIGWLRLSHLYFADTVVLGGFAAFLGTVLTSIILLQFVEEPIRRHFSVLL